MLALRRGVDISRVGPRRLSLKHRWMLLWASRRNRIAAVVLVAGFGLSLVVFGGMTALNRYADRRMNARRLVNVVSADVDRLSVMPWDVQQQPGVEGTRREMKEAEGQLRRDLRTLSADASDDSFTREISADVEGHIQILERQRDLIAAKRMPRAMAANARGDGVHVDIRRDLARASAKYASAASRARVFATVGSMMLLLSLFLAFAVTLGRLLRSQRKHAQTEERLRQANKMEAVGQLAGGIAHDFNNLLTAVAGYAGLLSARVGGDGTALRYVGEIERASAHAADLTGQLLAFSRKQALQPRTISLNTVVTETRSILGRLIAADVEVDVALEGDLPFVSADPTQIAGVLLNLCTNAQDAMPTGGRLRIETRAADVDAETAAAHGVRAGRYAILSVTDSGSGVDEAIRDRIFDPFFTTKPIGKATGLGLASAYGTVQQSSGFIVLDDTEEAGARFSVYLPGVAAALHQPDVAIPDAGRDEFAATILVVEDQVAVRNLTAEILTRAGCRVVTAENGDEALVRFAEHPEIEILLSDVVMPGINGPELAERLLVRNPTLPVVFMSGYSGEMVFGRGVTADANLVKKPFTATELLGALRRSIDPSATLVA